MHILITVNAAWNLANFRRSLIEKLIADGHQVTALAPLDEHAAKLREIGCRFVPLEMDVKGLAPHRDLGLVLRFWRHFRRERPDAILSFTIKNNIYGAFAAGALGIPFMPTITGLGTAFLSGALLERVAERLYRTAFRNAEQVFFQNKDDRAFFLERRLVAPEKARLVAGSGIDLKHFVPTAMRDSGSAPGFLMIGRVLRDKGVCEYVEAARMVKERYPEATFTLLGRLDAKNRTAIDAATVRAWEDAGILSHQGHTPDVRPQIGEAACLVLPSYREGTPRTLLEGAAMARPVITTDVPGCREVVEDGRTGLLCNVGSAESLRDAMIRFIELPHGTRVAMGQAGRAMMERQFDEGSVIDAYRECLARVQGRHGEADLIRLEAECRSVPTFAEAAESKAGG